MFHFKVDTSRKVAVEGMVKSQKGSVTVVPDEPTYRGVNTSQIDRHVVSRSKGIASRVFAEEARQKIDSAPTNREGDFYGVPANWQIKNLSMLINRSKSEKKCAELLSTSQELWDAVSDGFPERLSPPTAPPSEGNEEPPCYEYLRRQAIANAIVN